MYIEVRINDANLRAFIQAFPDQMDDAITALGFDGQGWLMDKFGSDGSPSPDGGFPGIDTGTLKNSTSTRPAGQMAVEIFVATEYALPLEFGTSRMEARPFMTPLAHMIEANAESFLLNQLRLY